MTNEGLTLFLEEAISCIALILHFTIASLQFTCCTSAKVQTHANILTCLATTYK